MNNWTSSQIFDVGCIGVLILVGIFFFFYLSGLVSWIVAWFFIYWAAKLASKFIHGDD
jgi:hypothetical protein